MKKTFLLFIFLAVSSAAYAADDTTAHYYIPPAQFNAALQVMDLGFANVFGLIRNATGSFDFDSAAKSISHVRLALDASSLMASSPENQNDLAAMLAVTQYPEIGFTAPDSVTFTDNKAEIKGMLSLHGASKPFTLEATLNHIGKSPNGGGMWDSEGEAIGLSLHGTFKRADFGLADDPETPGRFGDTITLMLETQAIKQ